MSFNDIYTFVQRHSIGPAAISVREIKDVRYCIVYPYNYYIVYRNKEIYMLLPPGMQSNKHICESNQTPAVRVTDGVSGAVPTCVNVTFTQMYHMIQQKSSVEFIYKEILFEDNRVNSYTIEEILNRCIEKGIFTV